MASVAAACSRESESGPQPERRTAVTIDCAGAFGVDVRTFVEGQLSNGDLEIGWDEADRFRLWSCRSGDGTPVTAGADFALYHYDMTFPVARFKGEVDLTAYNAGGGIYNYYAVSPVPASEADVQGTRVSYTIPAVQTGQFDGNLDILTAQLLNAPALAEEHNPDIRLQFQHQVHVLRIAIPENRMGEDIRAMELTFPEGVNVAGRLTVDAAGASEPELTEGSSVIRLNFAEPKRTGDVVYVTIAPTTIPAEGVISMRIIGRTGETSTACLGGVARTMAAGHFSPVELRVPQMKVHYHVRLTFRLPADLGVSTLGEAVNKVTITPLDDGSLAGATLPDNTTLKGSELTYAVHSTDGRDFSVLLKPDDFENMNNKAITATFESENALNLTCAIAGKTLELNQTYIYNLSVPYLYDERFDGIASHDHSSTYEGSDASNPNPIALDSYGLPSWSGTRVGLKAGTSIRVMGRTEIGMGVKADYNGRVDSAPIAAGRLKPGKNPKVAVSFDYCTDRYNGVGSKTGDPVLSFGYMTQSGIIPLDAGVGTAFENGWAMSLDYKDKKNADHYGDAAGKHTYGGDWSKVIPACTEETRLSWFMTNNHGRTFAANGVYYIYIDNIKAKIVQ